MPNDARLGLVVGVTLVLLVGVLFARKEPGTPISASALPSPGPSMKMGAIPPAPVPGVPGASIIRSKVNVPRSHTVEPGETLMSLAVRYYGDAGQVSQLFRANQDRILAPDRLPIGTVLRIPEAASGVAANLER